MLKCYLRFNSLNLKGQHFKGKLGSYTTTKHLASGGMGHVYEAIDQNRKEVIIKFPTTHMPDGRLMSAGYHTQVIEKLRVESRVLKNFVNSKHHSIVQYIDESYDSTNFFLVIEKLYGDTITNTVSSVPLPENKVIKFSLDVLRGLEFLHKHNTIYRDMKPDNIIATKSGNCVLIDFGAAKQGMTQTNLKQDEGNATMFKSPGWTCPDQDVGRASAECDLYALGRVIFFMATGIKPFRLTPPTGKMTKTIREIKPTISMGFSELVNDIIDPEHNKIHTASDLIFKLTSLNTASTGSFTPQRLQSQKYTPSTSNRSQHSQISRIVLQGTEHKISNNHSGSLIGKVHDELTCRNTDNGCNKQHEGSNIFIGWVCPSGCRCNYNPAHMLDRHHMRIWKDSQGQAHAVNNDPNRRSAINRTGKWISMKHHQKELLKSHDQIALLYNEKKGPFLSFTFYSQ